jgi:hypothetical protein
MHKTPWLKRYLSLKQPDLEKAADGTAVLQGVDELELKETAYEDPGQNEQNHRNTDLLGSTEDGRDNQAIANHHFSPPNPTPGDSRRLQKERGQLHPPLKKICNLIAVCRPSESYSSSSQPVAYLLR